MFSRPFLYLCIDTQHTACYTDNTDSTDCTNFRKEMQYGEIYFFKARRLS